MRLESFLFRLENAVAVRHSKLNHHVEIMGSIFRHRILYVMGSGKEIRKLL